MAATSEWPEGLDLLAQEDTENPDAVAALNALQASLHGLLIQGAGVPVNGTSGSGAGYIKPGGIYLDTTHKRIYQNQNTTLSPTWQKLALVLGSSTES